MGKIKRLLACIMVFVYMLSLSAYAKQIVEVKHNNTKEEIIEIIKKYPHAGYERKTTSFSQEPKLTAPYDAGSVAKEDLDDALNAIKVVRYMAGVPYEHIKLTDELNTIAQHGAALQAASDQTGHHPAKPNDMSDEFFELAYKGCSEANLSYGRSNISNAVIGFIFDGGQNNLSRVGHRRWILKPGATNFGLGYANGSGASYGGHRISMHVFDGPGYWECESDSYIAWPPAGDMPIQYFAGTQYIHQTIEAPWSVNLGSPYKEPEKNDITLKLTRKSDGKVWVFNKNTPDLGHDGSDDSKLHLSVDNGGYGMTKAVVFRPDLNSLGIIKDGEVFNVELSGIKYTNGKAATLSYDINFFDLGKALDNKIILKIGNIKATVFGSIVYNDVSPVIVNGRTMLPARFVAEKLGATVSWNEAQQKVTINYKEKTIELFVGSDIAYVNGEKVIIDSPSFIENSRTYCPVRFIAESLDAQVSWNGDTQEVTIFAK